MLPFAWIEEARNRLAPYVKVTPLTYDPGLDIYLKWENQQVTGSFKARGALNKVATLQPWERARGLVTASAGNHGQGVALAGKIFAAPVTVFAPQQAVPRKVQAIEALGARMHFVAGGYDRAEQEGLAYAAQHHLTWVSAYNDGQVVAGQGTVALEILEQLPHPQPFTWVVPVGGGGLAGGIGAAVKETPAWPPAVRRAQRLVGVQAQASPFFHALFRQGTQEGVADLPTLADGLSGAIEAHTITLPLARRYMDDVVLVSEEEIAYAIAYAAEHYQQVIEGSAAAALAAVLSGHIVQRPAIVIISGGNIDLERHAEIVRGHYPR